MKILRLTDRDNGLDRGFLNISSLPVAFRAFFEEYAGKRAGALIGLISYLTQSPLDDVTMYVLMELRSMCQKFPDTILEVRVIDREEEDDN